MAVHSLLIQTPLSVFVKKKTRGQNSLKEDNMILPKIKKLQENMKKIKNNTQTVNIPKFVISSQSPNKVNRPLKC